MAQSVIFISYSHKDEKEKDRLLSHLSVLQHQGLIGLWSDDRIGAGADWKQEINEAMMQAKVAILLISANFLNSDFILGEEIPTLLKRCNSEGLTIFPVIAKACAWQEVNWLTRMNVRPKNGRPIWGAKRHVDEDLAAIAKEVAAIVKIDPQISTISEVDGKSERALKEIEDRVESTPQTNTTTFSSDHGKSQRAKNLKEDLMNLQPIKILREAIKAVPALKFALGITGIVSAIAIIASIGIDFRIAVFGTIIMLVLMVALVVFAKLSSIAQKYFLYPALFMLWSFLILTVLVAVLLFTSVFFNQPVRLRYWFGEDPTATIESEEENSILPVATSLPDEYLVVVSEFKPGLENFPDFDARDQIVSALKDAFANKATEAFVRIDELPSELTDGTKASTIGEELKARYVIWGRTSTNRILVNVSQIRSPTYLLEARFDYDPKSPKDAFLDEQVPQRIQTYLAPFMVGLYYYDQEEYSKSIIQFDEALNAIKSETSDSPDGVEFIHLFRGSALYLNGEYSEALEAFTQTLTIQPDLVEGYYNRALIYLDSSDFENALGELDFIRQRQPNYADGYALRAELYGYRAFIEDDPVQQQHYRDQAIDNYTTALTLLSDPDHELAFDIYSSRGMLLARTGKLDQAYADLEHILGPDNDCTPILTNATLTQTAPKLASDICAMAAINLVDIYIGITQNNFSEAEQLAELAVENAKHDYTKAPAFEMLALANEKNGKIEQACVAITQAHEFAPDDEIIKASVTRLCPAEN